MNIYNRETEQEEETEEKPKKNTENKGKKGEKKTENHIHKATKHNTIKVACTLRLSHIRYIWVMYRYI